MPEKAVYRGDVLLAKLVGLLIKDLQMPKQTGWLIVLLAVPPLQANTTSANFGGSMGKYFNQADVFPIIADSIRRIYRDKRDFVSHEEIVQVLLHDSTGKDLVEMAYQKQKSQTREWWASNMVAWFSQRITEGYSLYQGEFERKIVRNNWAYKPKEDAR